MNSLKRALPWLIVAMAILPVTLQADEKEELTWYAIELIVFEHSSELGRGAEVWSADPGLPNTAGAIELSVDGIVPQAPPGQLPATTDSQVPSASTDAPPPATALPPAFKLIPPSELRLTDVWNRLEKSSAYRPLLHIGWIQPGYASQDAPLVHIRNSNAALGAVTAASDVGGEGLPSINEPGYAPILASRIRVARDGSKAALDGTVKVHRARYLHVQADLLYYRPVAGGASAPSDATPAPLPDSPDTALIEQLMAEADATPRLFRLKESRRMRSRELHYLDHPLFGAVVEAWPLELPAPAPSSAAPAQTDIKKGESAAGSEPPPLPTAPSGSGG